MSDSLMTSIVTVLLAIIGVAIVAVLVSKNAQTPGVLQAGASSFSSVLGMAMTPITGQSAGQFIQYPQSMLGN